MQRDLNTLTGLPGRGLGAAGPGRQAGANALVFIRFCRSGLDLGQKYLEENFSSLAL